MNEHNQKTGTANGALPALAFNLVNILLFPVTLLGFIIWIGKGILGRKGSGVSATAQGPLSARWTEHNMGTRVDEAANRLMPLVPDIPPLGLRLTSFPLFFAHRLTGYVPRTFRYPYEGEVPEQDEAAARIEFFDKAMDRYLAEMEQFVILGAGFDTRAFRLPSGSRVRIFEVDTPKTQAVKREMLKKAGLDTAYIAFVAADFETEDWLGRLVEAGFDMRKPALFLWEGVLIYLEKDAVEDTLRKIASTSKGSVVAFDYFTSEALMSQALYWRFARASTKATGEPIKFGIDSTPPSKERTAEFLRSCGLTLDEQRTLGQETNGKHAWGGFATAIVK